MVGLFRTSGDKKGDSYFYEPPDNYMNVTF